MAGKNGKPEATPAEEGEAIELSIFIAAPIEIVFDFLLKPELLVRWIGRSRAGNPRPGDIFRLEFLGNDYVARGTYEEIAPPHRIAFTWGWEGEPQFPPGTSRVVIELEARGGGTFLRLRHSGLPKRPRDDLSAANHARRWQNYLEQLRSQIISAAS